MTKKERELNILLKVYNRDEYNGHDDIHERPDFILTHKKFDYKFGVEITEMYKNEATAVFRNNPNYLRDIIKGKFRKEIHKQTLEYDEYTLEDPKEGVSFKLPGVIIKSPNINEYCKLVNERINDKNHKYANYDQSNKYINLIIYDIENSFYRYTNMDVQNLMIDDTLILNIINSNFNEIFIVSEASEKAHIYNLKLNTIFLIIIKLIAYSSTHQLHSTEQKVNLIYSYFEYIGLKDIKKINYRGVSSILINKYVFSDFKSSIPIKRGSHNQLVDLDCPSVSILSENDYHTLSTKLPNLNIDYAECKKHLDKVLFPHGPSIIIK